MAEPDLPRICDAAPPVCVATASHRIILQVKSWLREHMDETCSIMLAGRTLPMKPGTTLAGTPRVFCVSPGEWMTVSPADAKFPEWVLGDLRGHGLAHVDVTDGIAALEIFGAATRELLAKGCGLDLHPRSFGPGQCARTRFAQIAVLIDCLEPSRVTLYMARSHLEYLLSWLEDAALEFGGDSR